MKAFIVRGSTGEYSDRDEWVVRGFVDKQKAETFEWECARAAKAYFDRRDDEYNASAHESAASTAVAVPGDPHFRCDYTGTDYYTEVVEIEGLNDRAIDVLRELMRTRHVARYVAEDRTEHDVAWQQARELLAGLVVPK